MHSLGNHRQASLMSIGVAAGLTFTLANSVDAAINLELRPLNSIVMVGQTVNVGLYAVSDSAVTQTLAATEAILGWNTGFVQLITADQTGATPWLTSGFLPDGSGLNTSILDGDALWIGLAPFSGPVNASPSGTLLSTFQFLALAPTPATPVTIPALGGTPTTSTIVYDGEIPNLDVTGTLSGATITILVPTPGVLAVLGLALVSPRRRREPVGAAGEGAGRS